MIELSYFFAFIFVFIACIRILHMNSRAEWPELFSNGTSFGWRFSESGISDSDNGASTDSFVTQILKHAPIFSRPYIPPIIWGRSGHLQTIIHSTLSRHKSPREKGDSRHSVLLSDGSTVTFDLFLPPSELLKSNPGQSQQDVTLVVCPGIGNSSETIALRTFSHRANEHGYRVAVLNHLGVIADIPLTSTRIFTYGSTEEYGAMVNEVQAMYPHSTLVAVGFSMGGNLVCKYLGENADHRSKFVAGISCCQGYDISRALKLLQTWRHIGNGYLRAVNICIQKILRNFQDVLLSEEVLHLYGLDSKHLIFSCSDVIEVDKLFLSRLAGYANNEDYYRESSSANYLPQIDIPMLLLNSRDDPLIPLPVLDIALGHTVDNDNALFVVTKHGGHLGFFECQEGSRLFSRGTYTWLDRVIMEYVAAVLIIAGTAATSNREEGDDSQIACDSTPVSILSLEARRRRVPITEANTE